MTISHIDDAATFADHTTFFTDFNLSLPDDAFTLDDINLYSDFTNADFFLPGQNETTLPAHQQQPEMPFPATGTSPNDQTATPASTDSEPTAESGSKMRRRAQNRASQRAFRERKEKHMRSLKLMLNNLGEKHRTLLESYSQQSEVAMKLRTRVAELDAETKALSRASGGGQSRCSMSRSSTSSSASSASSASTSSSLSAPPLSSSRLRKYPLPPNEFDKFDAFAFPSSSLAANQAVLGPHNPLCDRDKVAGLPSADLQDLPEFEDLLNL